MAPKGDMKAEGKALSAILSAAKKNPHSFAMLYTKGGFAFEAHKTKSIGAMRKAAKSAGGGTKGAWGTLSATSNSVTMHCEDAPPSSFAKEARKYFGDRGITVKVLLEIGDGAEAAAEPAAQEGEAPSPIVGEDDPVVDQGPSPIVEEPDDQKAEAGAEEAAPVEEVPVAEEKAPEEVDTPPSPIVEDAEPEKEAGPSPILDDGKSDVVEGPSPIVEEAPKEETVAAKTDQSDAQAAEEEDDEETGDELGADLVATILAARKRTLNFAWLLGDKQLVLRAHKRRPLKKLIKLAKAAGGKPRGAWGQMRTEGSKIILTCENTPPASAFKRTAKRQFKEMGLGYKVILETPEGTFDIDPEPAAEAGAEAALSADGLLARYKEIHPQVRDLLAEASAEVKSEMAELLKAFQAGVKARNLADAEAVLAQIERRKATPEPIVIKITPLGTATEAAE